MSVKFTPTATGSRTGTLTVTSNASNSPTTVALSGTGTSAATASLSASPSSLTFGSTTVGSPSAVQNVTITNTGGAAATVSGVASTGDFSQTSTCAGSTIAAGATCTVAVTFQPTATGARTGSVTVTSNATNSPTTVALSGTGAGTATGNLALNKPTSESSHSDVYPSSNVTDGNASTYWESANNAFPQWVQVDLGSTQSINKVTLKLPPATSWAARTETLSIQGSTNGTTWTTLSPSAVASFDPATGNTASVTFTTASARYVRVNVTANSSWPAGQFSEVEVYGPGGTGTATLAASPASLSYGSTTVGATSAAQTVTITNTGGASASISGVTIGGDFADTTTCGATLAAGASCTASVSFKPDGNRYAHRHADGREQREQPVADGRADRDGHRAHLGDAHRHPDEPDVRGHHGRVVVGHAERDHREHRLGRGLRSAASRSAATTRTRPPAAPRWPPAPRAPPP